MQIARVSIEERDPINGLQLGILAIVPIVGSFEVQKVEKLPQQFDLLRPIAFVTCPSKRPALRLCCAVNGPSYLGVFAILNGAREPLAVCGRHVGPGGEGPSTMDTSCRTVTVRIYAHRVVLFF
jgi:hypothetical protein